MKKALIVALMTVSFASHAHFYISPSLLSTMAPTLSSAGLTDSSRSSTRQKAAENLIKDANEFRASGTMSAKLSELVQAVQSESELSESEAVDFLEAHANSILDEDN